MARGRQSRKQQILSGIGARSIVLIGMMGCGKSAIGKMLAKTLNLEFKDADTEIEIAAGRSVPEIFEEYGEPEFRRLEARVIERLLDEGPFVLALGGGAFLNAETREMISQKGFSVWLKVDLETLLERVMRKPGKRPLLSKGNPKEIMQDLLEAREPVYANADLHVASKGGRKSDMRNHLVQCLAGHFQHTKAESAQ